VATDVRPIARRLTASLAVSWAGVQISGALGSVVVVALSGDLRLAGLPYVIVNLGAALAAYPSGHLMDRHGRVPVLLVGHLLAAAGFVVGSWAILIGSLPWFLAGLGIASFGAGATYLTRLAAADLYPAAQRGRGLAVVVLGASVGAILGTPLIALAGRLAPLLDRPDYLIAWAMVPLLSVASALIVSRIRPDPRLVAMEVHAAEPAPPIGSSPRRVSWRLVVLAAAALSLAQGAMACVMSVTGVSLEHAGHHGLIGATMTTHLLGMFAFSPVVGWLADRQGRGLVLGLSAVLLLAGAGGVVVLPAAVLIVPLFLVGLGWSFAFIGASAAAADAAGPLRRGRVTALVDVSTALCASASALAAGWALANGGLPMVGVVALALAGGVALAAGLLWMSRPPAPAPVATDAA
jgi:MFS family permease